MEIQTSSVADLRKEESRHFVATLQQASVQRESALVYAVLRQPNYVGEQERQGLSNFTRRWQISPRWWPREVVHYTKCFDIIRERQSRRGRKIQCKTARRDPSATFSVARRMLPLVLSCSIRLLRERESTLAAQRGPASCWGERWIKWCRSSFGQERMGDDLEVKRHGNGMNAIHCYLHESYIHTSYTYNVHMQLKKRHETIDQMYLATSQPLAGSL